MHLTVRMAWHDSNWNGKVCRDPEGNTYCTGAHSLLSGRIKKRKDVAYVINVNYFSLVFNDIVKRFGRQLKFPVVLPHE